MRITGIAKSPITLLNKTPIAINGNTQKKYFSLYNPLIQKNKAARIDAVTAESSLSSLAKTKNEFENRRIKKPRAAAK